MKPQAPTPYREERPWGSFERFTQNEASTVKIITVKPGQAFSLQTHAHRDEWWKFLSGDGTVRIGDEDHGIRAGDEYFIARGTAHRVTADTSAAVFLEVAFGDFDEGDIVRIEDRYGRT